MFIAAPITALFVARDTLNFGIVQAMIVMLLVIVFLFAITFWPHFRKF
jgi:hypothetical protein